MTPVERILLIFNFVGLVALSLTAFSPRKSLKHFADKENEYERWLLHAIRLFPDGGLALVDADGLIVECSIGFAKLVNAESTFDCKGQSIDSFHVDNEAYRQMRESMRRDIIARPVSIHCVDGVCKIVSYSVFDLEGIWLVRMVANV